VLADKGYDSRKNRNYCDEHGIEHHIPHRIFSKSRHQEFGTLDKRALQNKNFDEDKYKRRALVESIISAIKRPFGAWVCSRKPSNQQKEVTLKILAYNFEVMGHTIKSWLFIFKTRFLQSPTLQNN